MIETTADTVGTIAAAAAAGGIAVHAISTNIRKHRVIKKEIESSEDVGPDGSAPKGGK